MNSATLNARTFKLITELIIKIMETRNTIVDDRKAEELANKWNVSFCDKIHRERKRYYIHGHSSTVSDTKLEAITKYLE